MCALHRSHAHALAARILANTSNVPAGKQQIQRVRQFVVSTSHRLRGYEFPPQKAAPKQGAAFCRATICHIPGQTNCNDNRAAILFTGRRAMQFKRITICVALAFAPGAFAAEAALPDVEVTGVRIQPLPAYSNSALGGIDITHPRTSTSDTAKLLDGQPGVSLSGAGGVSSFPLVHGLADDRVRVKVDGMDLISSCANHMNPALSYIDPSNVGSVKVFAGITPVSVGGDSIGGTIQVDSAAPEFAAVGQGTLLKGEAGAFYRSNGNAQGGNLSATIAGEQLSMTYSGSTTKAEDYSAGGDFKTGYDFKAAGISLPAGDEVGSSMYKSTNQSLNFALR